MSKQEQRVGDAVRARQGELGISQRELAARAGVALTTVQDIQSGKRARLQAGTKSRLDEALEWAAGSIDQILSGGEPVPRTKQGDPPTLSPLLADLLTASHARLAEIAEEISADTGNPAEGDRWLQSVLQMRRPRDEVELKMLSYKKDVDKREIWSHIIGRRRQAEANDKDRRMGQSG